MNTPDPIDLEVGARIRARRQALGLSQTGLAQSLDLTFQQVQKYERGSNRISASKLVQTARALKTTVAELVGEQEGEASRAPSVFQALSVTGALELLNAFAAIDDANIRKAAVQMMRAVARKRPKSSVS